MEREQNMQETKTTHHIGQAERYLEMLGKIVADENSGLTAKELSEVLGTLIGGNLQIAGLRQNVADHIQQNVQAVKQMMMQQAAQQGKAADITVPSMRPPSDLRGGR